MSTTIHSTIGTPTYTDPFPRVTETEIEQTVGDKAALMDEIKPGWALKINPKKLNMNNGCQCILGRSFGHYDEGIMRIFETYGSPGILPFSAWNPSPAVHQAWVNEITKRKDKS